MQGSFAVLRCHQRRSWHQSPNSELVLSQFRRKKDLPIERGGFSASTALDRVRMWYANADEWSICRVMLAVGTPLQRGPVREQQPHLATSLRLNQPPLYRSL